MRFYDVGSRVQVFNVIAPQVVTHNTEVSFHNGTGATVVPSKIVDRMGYYSYVLQATVIFAADAQSEAIAMSMQLESAPAATQGATWTTYHTDVTSLLVEGTGAKDAYYKQMYVNPLIATHGTVTTQISIAGGDWYDQCADVDDATYGFNVTNAYSGANTIIIDARIMGSLRNPMVARYLAPNIHVYDTESDADVTYISANLILGGSDQVPPFEGGTAGLDNFYSKGQ